MDLAFSSQCNSMQLSEGSLRQDLFCHQKGSVQVSNRPGMPDL